MSLLIMVLGISSNGGIFVKNGALLMLNSIASGNSQSNCELQGGTIFTSIGHNLFGNSESVDNCIASMQSVNKKNALINVDPKLQPLSDVSSGFGFGHELSPVSPAINAGSVFICNEVISSPFVLSADNAGGDFSGFTIIEGGQPLIYRQSSGLDQSDQRNRQYDASCDLGALEFKDFTTFFSIPIPGKGSVVIPL